MEAPALNRTLESICITEACDTGTDNNDNDNNDNN
jgi:hypothetical protein